MENMHNSEFNIHGWHLRKEITIGQIGTLIVTLVSILWWATSVESRLAIDDARHASLERRNERLELRIDRDMADIKKTLFRIEEKLDKKADK